MDKDSLKQLEKVAVKVKRKAPNAKLNVDWEGNFFITDGDTIIAEDYFFPPTKNKIQAWEYALLAIKTTQHFNRTHPLKTDFYGEEEKIDRIHRRQLKGKVNSEKNRQ